MKHCKKHVKECFHKAHMKYLKKSMDEMVCPKKKHNKHKKCKR